MMSGSGRFLRRRGAFNVLTTALSLTSAVVIPAIFSISACASDPSPAGETEVADGSPSAPTTPGTSSGGPSGTPDSSSEAPPPPCDPAQAAAIQTSFEGAAPDDIDAVAIVKDPSCGVRYFTRGPSKIPESALHLIASNSKTHLASLILLLVEDGKLHFDDPASKWIDDVPGGDAIKIRHLLDHTSGLYNYTNSNFYMLAASAKKKYTPQDLVDISFKSKVSFAPGEEGKWEYSNTNYVLLGMIAEKVGGKPVEQLLRERILTPIGAKATFFYGKEEVVGEIAPAKSFLGTNGATFMDPSAFWCAGSYVSTMRDLADWVELRANGKFHSATSQAELMNAVPTTDERIRYGAGVMLFNESSMHNNGPAIGHGGDLVGYHSFAFYFPNKKTTVVVMEDSDKGPTGSFPLAATYRSELFLSVIDPLFGTKAPADAGAQ